MMDICEANKTVTSSSAPMETMHKKEATETASHEDNSRGQDISTDGEIDPWNPPFPRDVHVESFNEFYQIDKDMLTASRATNIIIRDRTPQIVEEVFDERLSDLLPVLQKDSVRLFLRLFQCHPGLSWGYIITPSTFTQMVVYNSLRCAKAVLEGKHPELTGHRANPNYMNMHGFFPLHQAAELLLVDMIKLLFQYGASANLRTVGPQVIEGLLPLHIAVENTCRHKFLEDNLQVPDDQDPHDYVYRLIHLLCLPEMKIFLDTTRLIAEKTDNLLDELWGYMKDGKLCQAAVLLLAAQKQLNMGASLKKSGNSKPAGFCIIFKRVADNYLELKMVQNRERQLEANTRMSFFLAYLFSEVGEALDSYVRTHPEVQHQVKNAMQGVSHVEVFEHVSSILKNRGFYHSGHCINVGNLRPFERHESKLSDDEVPDKYVVDGTAVEGVRRKKRQPRGWEQKYARRSYLAYWKALLGSKCWEREAARSEDAMRKLLENEKLWDKAGDIASSRSVPNHEGVGLLARTPYGRTNLESKRLFGTVASTISANIPSRNLFGIAAGTTSANLPSRRLFGTVTGTTLTNLPSRRLFGTAACTILKLLKHA